MTDADELELSIFGRHDELHVRDFPVGICPRSRTARGALKRATAGRGINGGDPRLRGEAAVNAAKAGWRPLEREQGVIGSLIKGNPPSPTLTSVLRA